MRPTNGEIGRFAEELPGDAPESLTHDTMKILRDPDSQDLLVNDPRPPGRGFVAPGVEVASRVTVTPSETVDGSGVRVRIRTVDGAEVLAERREAPGDPERPLSRADVEAKLARASRQAVVA